MLGADLQAKPADYVKDVSEANFMAEVVDKSMTVPVIVDFWAPWCGPCKTLGPQLEAEVNAAKGKVVMAKVNVDENQMIASQLRIQSIPTVYAFWQGQPVDAFQGALPGSEIKAFVQKLAGLAGDGGLADAIAAAEEMLTEGAAADAAETFAAILEEEPENAEAYAGLIRAHIAADNLDQAEGFLGAVPAKIATAAPVEADPADHQARFDYATALHAGGDVEEAVNQLLELFRRDREWNEGAAKTQLFTIFEALKPNDPIGIKGRRRLSSMIFA